MDTVDRDREQREIDAEVAASVVAMRAMDPGPDQRHHRQIDAELASRLLDPVQ